MTMPANNEQKREPKNPGNMKRRADGFPSARRMFGVSFLFFYFAAFSFFAGKNSL